jgi:predicted AAA+ superfamily ATPase
MERLLDINPWQRDPSRWVTEIARRVPSTFIGRRLEFPGQPSPKRANIIVGPRQAGKSTLVWSWLGSRPPETVLFINAEEHSMREWVRSPTTVLHDLETAFPSVTLLFFEEAQHLENAGLAIKGLVDSRRDLEILVTGSSSFHLGAKVRESLAGRASRGVLLPLSTMEVLAADATPVPAARRSLARKLARRMMVIGGYPGVWLSGDPWRELRDLVDAFVLRDASDRFRVQRPDAMRRLLQLVAGQVGQMASFAELAGHLGISAPTVREYLGLLEETWIVKLLPAFAGGKRREITTSPRIHFYDPGIRNALLGATSDDVDRRADRGALAEAFAFTEICKILPPEWIPHYWRAKGGAEVDFVLSRGDRCVAVEVKSGSARRLSPSARSFIDAYAPTAFLVASGEGETGQWESIGASRVRRVALEDLAGVLLEVLDADD